MVLPKTLNEQDQNELMLDYKLHGNKEAREKLILCNMRLAMKLVNKYCFREANIDDCSSIAFEALTKAIDSFNITYLNDNKISTYLTKCIQQNIYRYLDRTYNKPISQKCISLNTPIQVAKDGEEEVILQDTLADENFDENYLYDLIEKREILNKINNFLQNHCTIRTQKLFAYKFGLGGYPVLKEKEIGEILHYKRGHIAMIYARVLKYMKNYLLYGKIPKNRV
jgi:RNA polymerase sigma factor (sigma-70 family)